MKNNETGEFELVLGNRQLLSGFFIVALLFGVAFAMGYIVGRSSTPSAKLQVEAATGSTAGQDARPQPAAPAPGPTPAPAPAEETTAADQQPADTPPQPTTQPAREVPANPAAEAPAPAPAADADSGTYWQVSAVQQATAEIFAKALKDKGFPVTLSPGPKNLTRVLVGPYPDTQSLGRAKSELENAGFHPIILKK